MRLFDIEHAEVERWRVLQGEDDAAHGAVLDGVVSAQETRATQAWAIVARLAGPEEEK